MPKVRKVIHNGTEYFLGGGGNYCVDVLVVGGGGSGGNGVSNSGYLPGGGGGAGGVIMEKNYHICEGSYPIIVGAGGINSNGGDSCALGLNVCGGGKGFPGCHIGCICCDSFTNYIKIGYDGGSGGGGGGYVQVTCSGGSSGCRIGLGGGHIGNGLGNEGGSTRNMDCIYRCSYFCPTYAGGGGGAGSSGCGISRSDIWSGGYGGLGITEDITCKNYTIAGGGSGGATYCSNSSPGGADTRGQNRRFGGGIGGNKCAAATGGRCFGAGGGGGAGCTNTAGGNGYQGVVVIRYLTNSGYTATGGVKYTCGDYTIHCFTSDGTFTIS